MRDTKKTKAMRRFETGAARHTDTYKLDFDGFLSIPVLLRYAQYMRKHRVQADGALRESDNWKKGIPREVYRKSAWRHFIDWAQRHASGEPTTNAAMALLFNIMGDTHEALKKEITKERKRE